jgi:hypothetical protein
MAQNLSVESTLTQQFISMTQGSASAIAMNLPNSLIEPFNLYGSTAFYLNYINTANAFNDYVAAIKAANSVYIAGYTNPQYLRMSLHFNGSGATIPDDRPLYNTTSAVWYQSGRATVTAPVHFTNAGGTASASTTDGSFVASNAFDGNASTIWSSTPPVGFLPISSGVASSANGGTPANAFDSDVTTSWSPSIVKLLPNGLGSSFSKCNGNANDFFNSDQNYSHTKAFDGLNVNSNSGFWFTNGHTAGTYSYLGYDLGAGNGIVANSYTLTTPNSDTYWNRVPSDFKFQGSNDNITYVDLDVRSGVTNWTRAESKTYVFTNSTNYRYYRLYITAIQSGGRDAGVGELLVNRVINASNPVYINYDSGTPILPVDYEVNCTTSGAYLKSWTFEGSTDNSNWDVLETVTGYSGAFPRSANISTLNSYRYFRLNITDTTSATLNVLSVHEITINKDSTSFSAQQLNYDCGVLKLVQSYTINALALAAPTDWTFESSNDGNNWVVLDTVTAYASTFPVTRTIPSNFTSYRYYRLNISAANNKFVKIKELSSTITGGAATCDTVNFSLGTASLLLTGNSYLNWTSSANWVALLNKDWNFNCRFNLDTIPVVMSLFTHGRGASAKSLEIQLTANKLRVNYSTNGTSFTTIDSSDFVWSVDTWYHVSVGRTGNTLYMFINGSSVGTADLTGVTLFNTTTNGPAGYIGADSLLNNLTCFVGNIDELEFFAGINPYSATFTPPATERTTAYVPAISWQSKASYMSSTAAEVDVVVFVDKIQYASFGAPEFGTEAHFYISLDNGSTFHEVDLVNSGNLTQATSIYRGRLDTLGVTNTNQLVYKITSDSGKVLKYDGACLYWQDGESIVSLTASDVWNYVDGTELTAVPNAGSSVKSKLDGLFQYFFNKREVTATAETMYKVDNTTALGIGSIVDTGTKVTKGTIEDA